MVLDNILLYGVFLIHILLVLGAVLLIAGFKVPSWIKDRALWLGFYTSLIATAGSLYYSEFLNYTPCELCWYQRIFMYVLPLIFGSAIIFNDKKVIRYALPISVAGFLIGVYHYLVQVTQVVVCTGEVDCAVRYTFGFGYITIPFMALTTFLLTVIFAWLAKK